MCFAKYLNRLKMKFIMLSTLAILFLSCENSFENSNVESVDYDKLIDGLIETNSNKVNAEINKLTDDLLPKKTDNDRFGHCENINLLVDILNKGNNDIVAELVCYVCIETNPPQSEIRIALDSSGSTIRRMVDILTPADAVLECIRVH